MNPIDERLDLFSPTPAPKIDSPKQLTLEVISAIHACHLNSLWHSRLPKIHWSNVVRNTAYICFGAKFDGFYVATGIWSSPVAQNRMTNGERILELRKLAISEPCPKNTATWMISKMVKVITKDLIAIDRLISYQDTEVHRGTIYKAANWIPVVTSKGTSWTNDTRKRNTEQSIADKVRWEYYIPRKNTAALEANKETP